VTDDNVHISGDGILNVRVIRDPKTFIGKGIAYIQFATKSIMRVAIENKNGVRFMGRELRIKKAVAPKRLEKKAKGKEERALKVEKIK
jgi:RNA recognition motif-containing protein